jgi:hypothetical protein
MQADLANSPASGAFAYMMRPVFSFLTAAPYAPLTYLCFAYVYVIVSIYLYIYIYRERERERERERVIYIQYIRAFVANGAKL